MTKPTRDTAREAAFVKVTANGGRETYRPCRYCFAMYDAGYDAALESGRLEREAMIVEKDKWRLALESLTPGGSEFVNDIENCLVYCQRRRDSDHETIKRLVKELKAIKTEAK